MENVQPAAKSYAAPVLTHYGSFTRMTLGESTGDKLDADFPRGTPFGDLTFS